MALIAVPVAGLWAAEGRDERDTLVAIGASPSTLATIAALKAGLLAGVGTLIAVPLGFGLWLLADGRADQPAPFPWLFAVTAVVLLPAVIGGATWLGSRRAQRARPARAGVPNPE